MQQTARQPDFNDWLAVVQESSGTDSQVEHCSIGVADEHKDKVAVSSLVSGKRPSFASFKHSPASHDDSLKDLGEVWPVWPFKCRATDF